MNSLFIFTNSLFIFMNGLFIFTNDAFFKRGELLEDIKVIQLAQVNTRSLSLLH